MKFPTQCDHRQRQDARVKTAVASFHKYLPGHSRTAALPRFLLARVRIRNERNGEPFDDRAVLHRARAGERSRISADRICRPLDRPQREDVKAGASSARLVRNDLQSKRRVQTLELRHVRRIDQQRFGQDDQFAVVGHTGAGGDPQSLEPAALHDFRDEQSLDYSAPARAAEVGLTDEEIILLRLEVGGGEESPVEPAWTPAARIADQDLAADEIVDFVLPLGGGEAREGELVAISSECVESHGKSPG